MNNSRTEIIKKIKKEFGYINPSDYTSVDFAVRYFESRTCESCSFFYEPYMSCGRQIEYEDCGVTGLGFMTVKPSFGCNDWEAKKSE